MRWANSCSRPPLNLVQEKIGCFRLILLHCRQTPAEPCLGNRMRLVQVALVLVAASGFADTLYAQRDDIVVDDAALVPDPVAVGLRVARADARMEAALAAARLQALQADARLKAAEAAHL